MSPNWDLIVGITLGVIGLAAAAILIRRDQIQQRQADEYVGRHRR